MDYKNIAITRNLTYLCDNLCDLLPTLIKLVEDGVISRNEKDEIESKDTDFSKNDKLFSILLKKDISLDLLTVILRKTNNSHLANKLEIHFRKFLSLETRSNINRDNLLDLSKFLTCPALGQNLTSFKSFSNNDNPKSVTTFGLISSNVNQINPAYQGINYPKKFKQLEFFPQNDFKQTITIRYEDVNINHTREIERKTTKPLLIKMLRVEIKADKIFSKSVNDTDRLDNQTHDTDKIYIACTKKQSKRSELMTLEKAENVSNGIRRSFRNYLVSQIK